MNIKKWWDECDNRLWFWRTTFSVGLIIVIMMIVAMSVDAAPVENEGGAANGIFVGEHMKLDNDEDAFYEIDTAEKTAEQMEQGLGADFMDGVKGLSAFGLAKNSGVAMVDMAVDGMFTLNKQMVSLMIGFLNFGFNNAIVDSFIDMVAGVVQDISGLSGTNIGGGIFGTFIMFAIIAAVTVTAWQMIVRNSSLAGLQTMTKSILAIAISFLLIANFATVMRGMNDITSWVSASALTGTTNFVTSDNRSTDEMMDAVDKNMWDLFIGKPYLVLQYGTDDVEMIGEERINELLALPPGEERTEYVQETEVGELGNENMTIPNILERLGFTALYTATNALVSLPVFAIALMHIVLDFWFLLMAFLAPFVTITAVFPGQFGVLKRYGIELAYPLILKILLSFTLVFIFGIGFVAYALPAATGMPQYFTAAAFQLSLFLLLFIMRKRIKAVFSAGSHGPFNALRTDIQDLRHSVDKVNGAMGKGARMAGHIAIGAVTGGATTSASVAVETMLKKRKTTSEVQQPLQEMKPTAKPSPNVQNKQPLEEMKPMTSVKDHIRKATEQDIRQPYADMNTKAVEVKSDEDEQKGAKPNDSKTAEK